MKQKLLTDFKSINSNNIYEDKIYNELITDLEESKLISVEEALYLRNFDEYNHLK